MNCWVNRIQYCWCWNPYDEANLHTVLEKYVKLIEKRQGSSWRTWRRRGISRGSHKSDESASICTIRSRSEMLWRWPRVNRRVLINSSFGGDGDQQFESNMEEVLFEYVRCRANVQWKWWCKRWSVSINHLKMTGSAPGWCAIDANTAFGSRVNSSSSPIASRDAAIAARSSTRAVMKCSQRAITE